MRQYAKLSSDVSEGVPVSNLPAGAVFVTLSKDPCSGMSRIGVLASTQVAWLDGGWDYTRVLDEKGVTVRQLRPGETVTISQEEK